VRDTLGALGELHRRQGGRLRWVLGVDMAHMGPRYGDAEVVRAGDAVMTKVASLDQARLERIIAGDAEGFWKLAHQRGNDTLKWCGSSPLYTFMRAVPEARGRVLHYDQWNIDDTSVVTFAALRFDL
jgi:MEMO1 family protein